MIRNIVFDVGDVLLGYHPMTACLRHAKSPEDAEAVFAALFMSPEWGQKLDACLISETEMLEIAQTRLPTPELKELCARVFADYHEDALTPIQGMDRVVASLRERGFGLYVLSNVGERFHAFKHKIPCVDLFDGFVLSGEEKLLKPDPALFVRLCSRFSLCAEECLFIDDRQANVDGAVQAGLKGYAHLDGNVETLDAFLKDMPKPRE